MSKFARMVKKVVQTALLGVAIFGAAWCGTAEAQITTTPRFNEYNGAERAAMQRAADYWSELLPGVSRAVDIEKGSLITSSALTNPLTGKIWMNPGLTWDTGISTQISTGDSLQTLITHEMGHTFGLVSWAFNTEAISGGNPWIDGLAFFALPIHADPKEVFWISGNLIGQPAQSNFDENIYYNNSRIKANSWLDLMPGGMNPKNWTDGLSSLFSGNWGGFWDSLTNIVDPRPNTTAQEIALYCLLTKCYASEN